MADYDQVSKALASGADPAMLCMTCPWDRYCVQPPAMTRADIDAELAKAKREDMAQKGPDGPGIPMHTLLTAMTTSGRDNLGQMCPVFALRLRSPDGRTIADGLKATMQAEVR